MKLVIFILTILTCIKTLCYGIYEIKKNNNKIGGTFVILVGIFALIFPSIVLYIR